tara:strand:- start:922 stop:1659 length:738 start_codon:yes stop_codon:yes gene_type:complete
MKKNILIIFTLLLLNMQAFAQEKSDSEQKTDDSKAIEEKVEEEQIPLAEKLPTLPRKNLIIYEFNPVKNKDGIVTLVEFNDLGCKECLTKSKEFYAQLSKENMKHVKVIYKHANSNNLNLVNQLAISGLVADSLGKFWEFKKQVGLKDYSNFDNQISLFLELGADKNKLTDLLNDSTKTLYRQIDADANYAASLKSKTVPMFYLDGYKVQEDLTVPEVNEYIQTKVDSHLKAVYEEQNKYKMGKF